MKACPETFSFRDRILPYKSYSRMAGRPKTSLLKDSFRKRKHTVFSKAGQLADGFDAHVYVVVQFNGRYHVYDSGNKQHWPPSAEMIVGIPWEFPVTAIR
jgi:hypothetical protein